MSPPPGLLGQFDAAPEWAQSGQRSILGRAWTLPRLWWLNAILFVFTIITTTTFGFALTRSFKLERPFTVDDLLAAFQHLLHGDWQITNGLVFSAPLLAILLAHEMGHYVVCLRRGVDATLPFFLPSPTLFGTLGAFIRIKTPIYARRDLFDIGMAGPLAGFLTLLPFLWVGVNFSHPLALAAAHGDSILIATPKLLGGLEWLHWHMSGPEKMLLHPMAIAALAGMLLTALNLLPVGQLDGGHIVYAVFGERAHKFISMGTIGALVVMGKFYFPWWIWAAVLFFLGRGHPLVFDQNPVSAGRRWLAALTLVILVVSASVAPTRL